MATAVYILNLLLPKENFCSIHKSSFGTQTSYGIICKGTLVDAAFGQQQKV